MKENKKTFSGEQKLREFVAREKKLTRNTNGNSSGWKQMIHKGNFNLHEQRATENVIM